MSRQTADWAVCTLFNGEGLRVPVSGISQEELANEGFEIVGNTPEQASAFFKAEIDRWAVVVKASGATVD